MVPKKASAPAKASAPPTAELTVDQLNKEIAATQKEVDAAKALLKTKEAALVAAAKELADSSAVRHCASLVAAFLAAALVMH